MKWGWDYLDQRKELITQELFSFMNRLSFKGSQQFLDLGHLGRFFRWGRCNDGYSLWNARGRYDVFRYISYRGLSHNHFFFFFVFIKYFQCLNGRIDLLLQEIRIEQTKRSFPLFQSQQHIHNVLQLRSKRTTAFHGLGHLDLLKVCAAFGHDGFHRPLTTSAVFFGYAFEMGR